MGHFMDSLTVVSVDFNLAIQSICFLMSLMDRGDEPCEALHPDPFASQWVAPEAQTTNDHHEAKHEISRLHTDAIIHLHSVSETYRIWSRLELMSHSPSSVCHQFLQKSRLLLGYTRTEHPFQAEGEERYSCQAEKAHTTPLCSSCPSLRS